MKFLIINGPNLNLLGLREPGLYGRETYDSLCGRIAEHAEARGAECEFYQSNHEGDLVDAIQGALGDANGIIINPGAYTHTSVAVRDALSGACVPAIEVHLSNISDREDFRKVLITTPACRGMICGMGEKGYALALTAFCDGSVK